MKFKVSSNKETDKNEMTVEAIDESDALSQFVKANKLDGLTSSHKFSVDVVGEDDRGRDQEELVEEPEPQVVEEEPKSAAKPKKTRSTTKKGE